MNNKSTDFLIKIFITLIFLFISAHQAWAQEDTVHLQEIEVYGIRPEISTNSSSPVQQMTSRKIHAIPTASVAEALRNFSGVVIKDYGGVGGLKTVMIRSMGANHTSVFVDGLPTTDAATGQVDLGKISLQDVNDIKLAVGQPEFGLMPARMHSSATIISIRSREPDFAETNHILNLSARAGSFSSVSPSIALDSKINNHTTTGVRVNYFTTKGNFPYKIYNGSSITDTRRNNSDVKTFEATLTGSIQFPDTSQLRLKATYYDSDRGLPGAVILYNPYSKQRLLNKDLNFGLTYNVSITRKTAMMARAGLAHSYLLYTDPSFLNQSGGLKNHFIQDEYFLSDAISILIMPSLKVAAATDLIVNKLNTNAYSIENPSRITSYTALSFILKSPLQLEIQGSALVTATSDKTNDTRSKRFLRLTPGISLLRPITADKALKVRIMYKNIFRLPTFNDLYYTLAGNNDLLPENAQLYNLGLIYSKIVSQNSSFNIRADGFMNLVTNKIITVPSQNLFIWRTQNVGKAEIKGTELFAGFTSQINKNWSFDLNGSYTYQNARDVSDKQADNFGNQLPYIPYETAGGLFTAFFKNYSLGINTLYNGFRYSSTTNNKENLLNSWTTTDVTLTWQKKLSRNTYIIKLEVANLFGTHYEIIRNFPMTGRAFYINFNITL